MPASPATPHVALIGGYAVNVFEESADYGSRAFASDIAAMKSVQGDNQPFYVMNPGAVVAALDEWHYHLPRVNAFYSVHCNDDSVLLRLLAAHRAVAGFSCLTREEVETAMAFVSADRVLYGNHLWTKGTLRRASDAGVGLLAIDDEAALFRVASTCPNARVILNVAMSPNEEDVRTSYGCSPDTAAEIIQQAADLGLNLVGLAFHIGSGCRDSGLFASAIRTSAELFSVARKAGLTLSVLNIGGGFSGSEEISDENSEQLPTFAAICSTINHALDTYFPSTAFPGLQIIAQPGRFFARNAFTLATSIIGKKAVSLSDVTNDDFDADCPAYVYQINEGFYGSFGCRMASHCEPRCLPLIEEPAAGAERFYGSVVGPTSDEFDVAQAVCHLRQMAVGDWLLWPQMGAYSRNNRGSLGDVDLPTPAVYYFCGERDWHVIEDLTTVERPQSADEDQTDESSNDDRDMESVMSLFDDAFGADEFRSVSSEYSTDDEAVWSAARWPFVDAIFD